MTVAPWRIGSRAEAPGGLILAARVVLGWAATGKLWEGLLWAGNPFRRKLI